MTSKRKFKKLVRAHAEKTGLPYTAALRSFLVNTKEKVEMNPTNINLDALLRKASEKAVLAGLNWVGIEHVLLVLADSSDSLNVAAITKDIEASISERKSTNDGWQTVEATDEFLRLAQLLTFQKQFTPGGRYMSAPKIVDAIVQDNPMWRISTLLRG